MGRFLRYGVVGALLTGAVIVSGCGGKGDGSGEGAVYPGAKTFESWDGFLSSPAAASQRDQVVVIGIDAGVWHVMDRLIDEGRLPNMARMKSEGAWAPLMSVPTYVTPPAWTSMFTGYLPVHTGVYSFGYWDEDLGDFLAANSDDILVPSVWEAASRAGLETGVFNVPMTYPPHPVHGAMVTGQMTPIEMENPVKVHTAPEKGPGYQHFFRMAPGAKNYARPVAGLLEDSLNVYLFFVQDTIDDRKRAFDTVAMTVMSRDERGEPSEVMDFEVFPTKKFSPWLSFKYRWHGEVVDAFRRFNVTYENDDFNIDMSQVGLPIEASYTYPEELRDELTARFGYYLPTKFFTEVVVPALTEDMVEYASFFYDYADWDLYCFVFTQTDNIQHLVGYTDLTGSVYEIIDRFVGTIMRRLPAGATLVIASDHGSKEYEWGVDVNQLLAGLNLLAWESPGRIDHERTVVFHNQWQLYFNDQLLTREELARRGYDVPASVEPRQWLVDFLRSTVARSPDGSAEFVVEAVPLPPDAAGHAPDMELLTDTDDHTVIFWNIMNPGDVEVRRLVGSERYWHSRDGVFLMWGDKVKEGFAAGPRDIQNVAPTLLYLLGLPVAPDMDGRIMTDLFRPGGEKPIYVNRGYRDIPHEIVLPGTERETLRKKLRSLGYIQ